MKKQYPILYSLDTKGKVRVWYMEQEDNCFRTISGLEKGQKVITRWTICVGKNLGHANETSPEKQTSKEIESQYKKQIAQKGYFLDKRDIDEVKFISPMLAKKYEDYKDEIDWAKGVYISPKMDGVRCIITKDGAFSRNGKVFVSFPHILKELAPLFSKYSNLVLDGEIYCDKLSQDFNKIISLTKKSKPEPEDFQESEKYLQYWIFDCPSAIGCFNDRYWALVGLYTDNFLDNKWIKLCKHTLINNPSDIERWLDIYIKKGFEGLMINTFDGKYENKRSQGLLKYKLFQDEEFEIVDIIEGIGNRSGMFGYAKLKMGNGKIFDSNARGNETYYTELLKNKKDYIGKMAIVRFQNLTPDEKVPRFPVIIGIRDYE